MQFKINILISNFVETLEIWTVFIDDWNRMIWLNSCLVSNPIKIIKSFRKREKERQREKQCLLLKWWIYPSCITLFWMLFVYSRKLHKRQEIIFWTLIHCTYTPYINDIESKRLFFTVSFPMLLFVCIFFLILIHLANATQQAYDRFFCLCCRCCSLLFGFYSI